ncbi:hypothetical protein ARMSODRAFT_1033585 [Armillaria solidipes]|uniref:F-box domain-containing protein n=1 Tax=Armillaria solidipes TaxID=1076256 RepID=A0A2H3BM33_9AGAR|nr:hypothetical protein ARMSODRAFT_1033585 [Armillaria solidipes]
MSCITCSNCGFVNFLPPEPQPQILKTIQSSEGLVSHFLRGSRPLLDSVMKDEIAKLVQLRSLYDAQLQEIQLRQYPVLKALENRRSIYAPIRSLPRDILIEIFHFVCHSWLQTKRGYRLKLKNHSLSMLGPLWDLGRVCGLWRNTLHTSPASWAQDILVKAPFSKHAHEIWQAYVNRTGEHPLSIHIIYTSDRSTRDDEIMSLLVQSCSSWKNLRLETLTSRMHHLEPIVSRLPVLQTIEICALEDDFSDHRFDMFLNSPQLWKAILPTLGIHQVKLPPGITHFSGRVTCSEDLRLLSQLPKLRVCCLLWGIFPKEAPVVMAQLRYLHVDSYLALDFLTAPMLESLAIRPINDFLQRWLLASDCITRFLRQSGCRLESLSMSMEMLSSEPSASVRSIFSSEACLTISYLKLEFSSEWYGAAEALAPSSILPNLRHLVLCIEAQHLRRTKAERFALFDMIRSRRDAGLKTIEVQFEDRGGWGSGDAELESDIRDLIGDNLEMRVGKWGRLVDRFPCC